MADSGGFQFRSEEDEPQIEPSIELPRTPSRGPIIIVALLVVAAAVAAYFFFGRAPAPEQAVAEAPAAEPTPPLGGEPAPIALPPLAETDPIVRDLVRNLSSHPRVLAWLTTEGLIRNFTTVVSSVAEGRTPGGLLRPLRPTQPFQVIERDETIVLDVRSYDRYNPMAEAVAGIDPAGAAKLYSTLKPRIEEAYAELGFVSTTFDRTLERAIVRLLETPISNTPPLLVPTGIVYGFADPKLEELSGAQKLLLRSGPRNAVVMQNRLREIALAIGIPAARLPAQSVAR